MAPQRPSRLKVPPRSTYRENWIANFAEWSGGKLLWIGIIMSLLATGFLIYYSYRFGSGYPFQGVADPAQRYEDAGNIIRTLQTVLIVGLLVFGTGMTFMFWGDIALPATLFLVAIAYFTTTYWLPMIVPIRQMNPDASALASGAMGSMALGGLVLLVAAIGLQVVDGWKRIRWRVEHGLGEDLKHGRDVEAVAPGQPVIGQVWRVPLMRELVCAWCPRDPESREKTFMPGTRLSQRELNEYCRDCVIFNEHQKQKYKLILPGLAILVAGFYMLAREPLLVSTQNVLRNLDVAMTRITLAARNAGQPAVEATTGPGVFVEVVLFGIVLFVLIQLMRVAEFCLFRLKI
ncbi:MAG: hypothetical protein IH851_03485 [Armatimonadetes bacterium]|nr:hypothetical protein [Armatimonadota bacterium]